MHMQNISTKIDSTLLLEDPKKCVHESADDVALSETVHVSHLLRQYPTFFILLSKSSSPCVYCGSWGQVWWAQMLDHLPMMYLEVA